MNAIALPQVSGKFVITNSRLACMKQCPRKHYYRYELGIRPDRAATPLRFGTAYHAGIDHLSHGFPIPEAIEFATLNYESLPSWCTSKEDVHEWEVERVTIAHLLAGYAWVWGNDAKLAPELDVVEVLASELAFDLPIINPDTGHESTRFRVAGKIDQIVKLRDGRIAVKENKTTGDDIAPFSDYWRKLRLDHQISLYLLAARKLGFKAETVLYDVTRKPGIRPKQIPILDEQGLKIVLDREGKRVVGAKGQPRQSGDAEQGYTLQTCIESPSEYGMRLGDDIHGRPDFYYARQEIPRLDADLAEFEGELWQQQQSLGEARRRGWWFRNTGACTSMGACEYLNVCHTGFSLADGGAIHAGFVQVTDLHPELITGD